MLDVRAAMPDPEETVEIDGLRLYALPAALVSSAPGFYRQHATEARAALAARGYWQACRAVQDSLGRFLMNLMLASGGYPWTVIPLEQRDAYMAALEEASVREDIEPFAAFLAGLVETRLEGQYTSRP